MVSHPQIEPPKALSRGEKREFRRVVAARNALGRPVAAAELNTLIDYVKVRDRLADLDILASRQRSMSSSVSYVGLLRMIDGTTALSRRLAHDLGLVPAASKPPGKKAAAEAAADRGGNDEWNHLLAPSRPPSRNPPS